MMSPRLVHLPDSLVDRWRRFLEVRRSRLPFLEWIAAQGDLVIGHVGAELVCYVNHPELIREVLLSHGPCLKKGVVLQRAKRLFGDGLLTSEGELHRRQRRLLQPGFARARLSQYGEVMIDCAEQYAQSLEPDQERQLAHDLSQLTLTIVARSLFHRSVVGHTEQIAHYLTDFMHALPYFSLPLSAYLQRLPLPAVQRGQQAIAGLDRFVRAMIDERRRQPGAHDDLLALMMAAHDVEGDGRGMSEQLLRDETLTLLVAGHETICNALLWSLYCVSQNPAVGAAIQAELTRVLGGRAPTVEDLPKLVYLEQVLAEAMRLYPPAWIIARQATAEFVLGGQPVRPGTLVAISQWALHRNPRFYPDPCRFDPERFSAASKAARPRFAYLPFSAGARGCIGEGYAWQEGVAVLACLLRRWRFELAPGQAVEPEPLITLRPKLGLRMVIRSAR